MRPIQARKDPQSGEVYIRPMGSAIHGMTAVTDIFGENERMLEVKEWRSWEEVPTYRVDFTAGEMKTLKAALAGLRLQMVISEPLRKTSVRREMVDGLAKKLEAIHRGDETGG